MLSDGRLESPAEVCVTASQAVVLVLEAVVPAYGDKFREGCEGACRKGFSGWPSQYGQGFVYAEWSSGN
jgi:hypothetical protein